MKNKLEKDFNKDNPELDLGLNQNSELNIDLNSLISPEAIFNFVNLHYRIDLGNDTPASSAEMEEAFRSYVYSLGVKGPRVEAFIQRAMTSIDDYDYTDKFDNIDQSLGTEYGRKVFGLDVDKSVEDFKIANQMENSSNQSDSKTFKETHKNNPFYIDPFQVKKPF